MWLFQALAKFVYKNKMSAHLSQFQVFNCCLDVNLFNTIEVFNVVNFYKCL